MKEEIYSTTESVEVMRSKTVEMFSDDHTYIEESVWVGELMGTFVDEGDIDSDDDDAVVGVVFGVRTLDEAKHEFYMARKPMAALGAMMFIKAMDDHRCDMPMCGVDVIRAGMHLYLDLLGIDSRG